MSPLPQPVILMRPHREPHSHDAKDVINRILSIAPILPGQKPKNTSESESKHQPKATQGEEAPAPAPAPAAAGTKSATPAPAPTHLSVNAHHEDNLIDFDSRPPSVAPPESASSKADPIAGNILHDTKNPKPTPVHQSTALNAPVGNPPKTANLMDDDDQMSGVNNQMSNMSLQQPMIPQGRTPLARMDTDTSELDVFVDAES